MHNKTSDPGFGSIFINKTKRLINKNGSFNVLRVGRRSNLRDTYQWLIKITWANFFLIIFSILLVINVVFAGIYFAFGVGHFNGLVGPDDTAIFLNLVHFSFQTFTTVGYGHIAPLGHAVSILAAIEAVIGLMTFALITGLIYGRFSRPSAKLEYSKNALISPYRDGNSLQFRIANTRLSMLMEMQATVTLQINEEKEGQYVRNYYKLDLERSSITFFPLNWTLVHPINEKSPLYQLNEAELVKSDLEVLILIKGFDDTFGQVVHSRYSYTSDELVWNASFKKAFHTDTSGDIILNINELHTIVKH